MTHRVLSTFFLSVFVCALGTGGAVQAQSSAPAPEAPLSLTSILSYTYVNNPSLMAAREELKEAQELYPQARAGWLPSVSAESSLYATDVESSNFQSGDGATTKDLTVQLDQPIWRGGRTFAETARAQDLIRMAEASLKLSEQDIFLSAIATTLDYVRDKQVLALRQRNEGLLSDELNAAQERFNIGDLTVTDVQQAKTRLSRAQSLRIQAQTDLDITRARFVQVVGIQAPAELSPAQPQFALPTTLDEMVFLGEQQNPEVLMAKYQHEASEHNIDAVFRELFPQISGFASINKQYDPQPGIVSDARTDMIGVRAKLALYQGGATRSRIRQARSNAKRREYEIHEIKRAIAQEVTANWRSYVSAQAQTKNRGEEIKAAEMALEGVRIEAKEGQRTVLDILDADRELIEAQVALANAQRNEKLAYYALGATLGLIEAAPE